MIEIIDKKLNHTYDENHNKKQIVLTHTSINVKSYITALKNRHFGKFNRVPNYIVTKDGFILQMLNDSQYTNILNNKKINKQSIIVSLENLGWLEKEPLKNHHINWIGDIYKGKVFEKKWREKFFWDPYTEKQIDSLAKLCIELTKKHKINLNCIGHNTKISKVDSFDGIITRSNIDETRTDVSPAFDFEVFEKKLKNE